MKRTLLLLLLLCVTALGAFAQCDAPTNVQATPHYNRVSLEWESSLLHPSAFSDSLTYGNDHTTGIGTGSAYTFTVAVRFPVTMLNSVDGQYLTHVDFIPNSLTVSAVAIKVWVGGSYADSVDIGTLVSTTNVNINDLTAAAHNLVALSTPVQVDISQGELWIGVEYAATGDHPAGATSTYVAGYNNFIEFGGEWSELTDLNASLTYGWCIAGCLSSSLPDITGFNVFRDYVLLNSTPITEHNFVDTTVIPENQYCYTIQSVCASTTSDSDPLCITTPVQPNCGPIIGNGTNTTYAVPFNTFFKYSYSQQIYTAAEMGVTEGTIVSIAFPYFYSTPTTMNDITVYIGQVNVSSFTSATNWIPVSELTQVFHGSVLCTNANNNLVTIDFDETFEWDGESNIVVAILNNQGSYENSDPRFYTHTTTGNTVLYINNDSNPYNINSPGSGTLSMERNNMQFCFGPAPLCFKPSGLEVLSTTEEGATVSWNRHSSEDSNWEVVVVPAGTSVADGTPISVNDTIITLTGLDENEPYDVYVRTICSSGDQSDWRSTSFRTRCVSIHVGVPFYDNFTSYGTGTDAFPYCWRRETTHESITYPYINSTSATTGQMIFFSNAETYSLAVSQGMDLSAYPGGSLALSYWIAQSQPYYGRMDIGTMTDPTDLSTFTLLRSYYPTDYEETTIFQEDYILLEESYPDIIYFAFLAPASGNNSTNITHLSRVKVDFAPSCSAPSHLMVSHVEGTAASLNWEEAQFGAIDYTLEYGEVGQAPTSIIVDGHEYMLTGLTQGTEYEVKLYSNCTEGDADTLTATFTTLAFIECIVPDTTGITITNASSASTSYLLPLNNFYNYTYSQQIYTANEINPNHTPTVITALAFNYGYSDQNTSKDDVRIYLAHRSSSSFSSTTDWTPISEATLVYEGSFVCSQGWNTFEFSNDFAYNGSDNLVVIIDDNSGGYDGTAYVFNSHTASGTTSLYYYNDSNNPDPASPPTASASTNTRSDIKLFLCDQAADISCPVPYLYITETEAESATVAWIANGNENEWNLEYKAEGENSWTSEGTVSSSPYTIQDLTTDVNYSFRLQALCDAGDSSEWSYSTAYIPCESTELPIVENFDNSNADEIPSCWVRRYNGTTAAPYVTSSQAYSGTKSLYFNCPNTGNYAYAISPRIDDDVMMDSLEIMFYAYTATEGYFIEVGIMSDPDDLSTFTPLGQLNPSPVQSWEMGNILSRGYAGEGHYVAFRVPQWNANNIYIDNIDIHYIPSCVNVTNIHTVSVTPYTAEISWTAGGSEEQWNYIYGPAGTVNPDEDDPMTANTNSITLTDLNANTLYDIYVQSNCGGGDVSIWMSTSFRTECAPMTTLPYVENFDTYTGTTSTSTNVLPNCWSRYNTGSSYTGLPTIYNSSSAAHSGNNSLYFYTYYTTSYSDQYAILPEIDIDIIPINTLQMSLAMRSYSTSYPFNVQVGVMTDPTDITTFQPVQTLTANGTTYSTKEVYFNDFTGSGNFIALKVAQPSSNYNYGYIDDIVLSEIPSCSPVNNITVSNIAGASALVSWENGHFGTVSTYTLEYSEAGQDNWITVSNSLTTTSAILSGLEPLTAYDVRVSVNCEDNSESDWVTTSFTTRCLAGGDIIIGEGTSTSNYIPSYSFYNYGYSQQIFTAQEMGGEASILTSVSLEMSALTQQRVYKIYLMHTSETSLQSGWINASNAQLVYTGNQTLELGWNTFNFTNTFAYNGTDNLLLIFVDETGSYVSGNYWYTHSASAGSARYAYTDSSPYSITTTPSSGTVLNVRNNVRFGGNCDETATCFAPNVFIQNISTNSADVVWVAGYDETSWEMEYTLYNDTTVWIPIASPAGGSVTLDQLTTNTHYLVRMRSVCTVDDQSNWVYADFRTDCGLSTIPFIEDFSSYGTGTTAFPDCWTKYNNYSTSTSYPYISTITHEGTAGSLYFYASNTTYNIAATPPIDADLSTLEVSFFLRVGTTTNGMIVGVMTDANNFDSFVPLDTVFCTATETFEYFEVDLDNYTGTGQFVAFKTYIVSSGALYIDDIYIDLIPSCKRPDNVAASNIDMTSANISWTERGTATSWEIEYGPHGFTLGSGTNISVTQNPYTLTNLTSATNYDVYVRSDCGNNDFSGWSINHASFATAVCDETDQCAYTFNLSDSYGDGWNGASLDVQQNGVLIASLTISSGSSATETVMLCDNISTSLVWHSGNYDSEASFTVVGPNGATIYTASYPSAGTLTTFTTDCNGTGGGIDNITLSDNSISLMPNPADNYIELSVNSNVKVKEAVVYNAFGQMIQIVSLTDNHARIDLSGLASGMYFVRVNGEKVTATKKFIRK